MSAGSWAKKGGGFYSFDTATAALDPLGQP